MASYVDERSAHAVTTSNPIVDAAARVFTEPEAYADEERFHAACAVLRRECPVPRVEVDRCHQLTGAG